MKKHRKSLVLRIAVGVFIAYLAVTLVGQQIQIRKKQNELVSLSKQYTAQKAKNDEIQRLLSGDKNEYIKSIARDKLNYVNPNERIYIDVSGN
ncbi:MAG TPA: septum formation initiator family protein [Clostridia bacterium]|nr:septum formation initiator family protein [Clostridia bacterium]